MIAAVVPIIWWLPAFGAAAVLVALAANGVIERRADRPLVRRFDLWLDRIVRWQR